jgi:hypothetical protein
MTKRRKLDELDEIRVAPLLPTNNVEDKEELLSESEDVDPFIRGTHYTNLIYTLTSFKLNLEGTVYLCTICLTKCYPMCSRLCLATIRIGCTFC